MIEFKRGDLFKVPADVRGNPVNCLGAMGAGLALAFKTKYPAMRDGANNPHKIEIALRTILDSRVFFRTTRRSVVKHDRCLGF